jgi:hypothetical protein
MKMLERVRELPNLVDMNVRAENGTELVCVYAVLQGARLERLQRLALRNCQFSHRTLSGLLQQCVILERLRMPARYCSEKDVQILKMSVVRLHTLELDECDYDTDFAYVHLPQLKLGALALRGVGVNIAHIPSLGIVERLCIDAKRFVSGIPAREDTGGVDQTPLTPVWSHLTYLQLRSMRLDSVMFPARRFPKLAVLDVSSYETKLPVRCESDTRPYCMTSRTSNETKIPIRRWFGDNPYTTTPALSTIICSKHMHEPNRRKLESSQEAHKKIVGSIYAFHTNSVFIRLVYNTPTHPHATLPTCACAH